VAAETAVVVAVTEVVADTPPLVTPVVTIPAVGIRPLAAPTQAVIHPDHTPAVIPGVHPQRRILAYPVILQHPEIIIPAAPIKQLGFQK
jgi:hypothetical protein